MSTKSVLWESGYAKKIKLINFIIVWEHDKMYQNQKCNSIDSLFRRNDRLNRKSKSSIIKIMF